MPQKPLMKWQKAEKLKIIRHFAKIALII